MRPWTGPPRKMTFAWGDDFWHYASSRPGLYTHRMLRRVALNSSAADKVDQLSLFAQVLCFGLDKCLKRYRP